MAVLAAMLVAISAFAGTVALAGTAAAAPGDVLYRVNAGGSTLSATDGGPDWEPDDQYLVAGETTTQSWSGIDDVTSVVPDSTPSELYLSDREDQSGGEEMAYEFSVPDGTQVEVRLYLANQPLATQNPGDRVFDVSVEGQTVLNDYDIVADVGHDVGTMQTATVVSDGTVDIEFGHETDNPVVSGIEVVQLSSEPDTLDGPSEVSFGEVLTGESETQTVTVTNVGAAGDPSIDISGTSITGTDAGAFSAGSASQTTLAPGESADIPVTFSPPDAQAKGATLEVTHSGSNSPLSIPLSGTGTNTIDVGFGSSALSLPSGVSVDNPTSLQFGPDGRLYVSEQKGEIHAFEVQRNGPNDYEATSHELIAAVQDIPNHNDDGSLASGVNGRQVTGILVTGTESNPVLYVTSSDPRHGGGETTPADSLDTNSGTISKLTWTGSTWDHTVLVRGLPRSRLDHSINGMALEESTDTLYVAQGGHTNVGAPSDKFGDLPEYALSGAILSVDLAQLESMTEQTDAAVSYKYDLPTLAGTDEPFGGQGGANMATLVQGGPVQVYSPGYRNPYDVVLTQDGQLYTVDNAESGGSGDLPVGEGTADCTNAPQEGGSGKDEELHHVTDGYYGGHANPTRGNPDGAGLYGNDQTQDGSVDGAVYAGYDSSVECDYQDPSESGQIATFGSSTNGITEYTASNFGGKMQGDLLTASFSGNVWQVELSGDGTSVTDKTARFSNFGSTPLDVTAQGDSGPFPGTVWVATYGSESVQVFEPNDYDTDGTACDTSDPDGDADGDGYTNGDEQTVGTDPCSAASTPPDYDGDGDPNSLDPDDDNDGQPDTSDPFAIDPDDGLSTSPDVSYTFEPGSEPGTILDLGFTGLMMTPGGQDTYEDLYVRENVIAGYTAKQLTIQEISTAGTYQNENGMMAGFQFGVAPGSEPFTAHTRVATPFPEDDGGLTPVEEQNLGLQIGQGDQDNFLKLTVTATPGGAGVQMIKEVGATRQNKIEVKDQSVTGDSDIDLYLDVDPSTDEVTGYYTVDGGPEQTLGTMSVPSEWLDGSEQGLAVGIYATATGAQPYPGSWDLIEVTPEGEMTVAEAVAAHDDGDDTINLNEIQTAINWWATGNEVPNTDGETISLQQMQGLINTWATGATVGDGGGNQAPTIDAIADQTVTEGESATVPVSASDPDGDSVSLSLGQAPSFVSLSNGELSITPGSGAADNSPYTVEVVADDGTDTTTESFQLTVNEPAATGDVLYRVNAGGDTLSATDDGPDWEPDDAYLVTENTVTRSWSGINDVTDAVPQSTPETVFLSERADVSGGEELGYEFSVAAGTQVEVRLYLANQAYQSDLDPGAPDEPVDRQIDVTIEGEEVLSDYDPVEDVGHDVGTMKSFVTVSDGTLDVDLAGDVNEELVFGIEIVKAGSDGGNQAPTIQSIADQTVTEGETAQVSVSASDLDGDSLTLSKTSGPSFVTLTDNGDGTGTLDITPGSDAADSSPHTVTVEASDGNGGTATESFQLTVLSESGTDGQVVYRINAGGDAVTVDGQQWSDGDQYATGGEPWDDHSIPSDGIAGTGKDVLYLTERHAPGSSFEYAFPVSESGQYRIVLHFAEIYWGAAGGGPAGEGQRVFSANAEGGATELDGYDLYADVGPETAVTKTYDVEVSDGTLNIDFTASTDGPQVGAIEVFDVSGDNDAPTPDLASTPVDPAADMEVTLDASGSSDADGSIAEYRWDVDGDGTIDQVTTDPTLTHVYPSDGRRAAVVTVVDDDGAVASDTLPVDVDGEVVYRVNPGGPELQVQGLNWEQDNENGASQYLVSGGDLVPNKMPWPDVQDTTDDVPSYVPDVLFDYKRFDDGSAGDGNEMQYEFPATDGQVYEVRLYFRNGWDGSDEVGQRIYSVVLEDEMVLDQYDMVWDAGDNVGTMRGFVVQAQGDQIDVDFAHGVIENPNINGIEIIERTDAGTTSPPDLASVGDQTVAGGETVTVDVSASDPDGDSVSLHGRNLPDFVSFTDDGDGTGTLTLSPGSGDAGTYEDIIITADDGDGLDSEVVSIEVTT